MKARFDALAVAEGGKSALLRRMLEAVVGQVPDAPSRPAGSGASEKITVRLRRGEQAAVTDAAAARGMTRTAWITSLIRAQLALGLPLSAGEEEALRAIARELNRIGGNVNQIARAANVHSAEGKPVSVDPEVLEETSAAVREAMGELRQVLGRVAGAWRAPL